MRRAGRPWSLAGQVFALQGGVALAVVVLGVLAVLLQAQRTSTQEATREVSAVAETLAASPAVIDGVQAADPTAVLQPIAEDVRTRTGTDFVVIMSPTGTRFAHPDPSQIGGQFLGHITGAAAGGRVVEDYTGTLGPSRRVVVPVEDESRVVGLVSVGIGKARVTDRVQDQLPQVILAALVTALLSGAGAALVARRVRRQTHGMGAQQLQEMYEYYDAVLHAVTEGLILTGRDGELRLVNDEAVRLLGLGPDAVGRPIGKLGLPAGLASALTDEEPREDELHVTEARVLVLNKAEARWHGRSLGHVATLRDRTDLEELTGELDTARGLTEALRSQAHEAANRLHTVVSLIELGQPERAMTFATEELATVQVLADEVVSSVEEPVLSALLLGKAAQASERGIDLVIEEGSAWPSGVAPSRDLVTIAGNLIDNALEAVATQRGDRTVTVAARLDGAYAVLRVADNGPGLPEGQADEAFRRGYSTKAGGSSGRRGIGLALVAQSVDRLDGDLRVEGPPGAVFTVRLPVERAHIGAGS